MAKTHEVCLGADKFTTVTTTTFAVLQTADIKPEDFILFKKLDPDTQEETGLYMMVQVIQVLQNEGLKDGYALVSYRKLT